MFTAVLLTTLLASAAVGLPVPQYYVYPWYYPAPGLQRALVLVESPPVYLLPYTPAGLQKGSFVTAEGPGGSSVLHEGVAYQVGEQLKQ